jgi:Leucine-rich repeat (LRR) protein
MPPKSSLSKTGQWALRKGADVSLSLNEQIDTTSNVNRLNLRSDFAEQLAKVLYLLEENNMKKENDYNTSPLILSDLKEASSKVKILYVYPPSTAELLNYFSLSSFSNLKELCLNQIPPSTILSFYSMREIQSLQKLIIIHSGITNLAKIFIPLTKPITKRWQKYLKPLVCNEDLHAYEMIRQSFSAEKYGLNGNGTGAIGNIAGIGGGGLNNIPFASPSSNTGITKPPVPALSSAFSFSPIPYEYCWNYILSLTLSNCGLVKIDDSLHYFPNLIDLDVSHNFISHIVHLQDCIALENINLSHNRIRILSNLERTIGSIKNLNLSYNEIESLDGIEKIYSLERINLSNNFMNDINEIQYLSRLPCLIAMVLGNNPIAEFKHYRLRVFRELIKVGSLMSGNRPFPELDRQGISKKELKKLR